MAAAYSLVPSPTSNPALLVDRLVDVIGPRSQGLLQAVDYALARAVLVHVVIRLAFQCEREQSLLLQLNDHLVIAVASIRRD